MAAIGDILSQPQLPGQGAAPESQEVAEMQAESYLVYTMVSACHRSIDSESVAQIQAGKPLGKEQEERVFKMSTAPPRPTRQEYLLLESVMQEEQARIYAENADMPTLGLPLLGRRGMSRSMQAFYALSVCAALGAVGLWALRDMTRRRSEVPRERTAKSTRRVAKATERLKRKMG